MEAPHLERKLVAILAADIEGFSSHMGRNEAATLAVLSSHRLIIDASIAEFGGRITSTAGDSVLAEFASVVSVINCAVRIQDLLADENAALDEAQRLFLRIGINVGDVMMKNGDIFGDGRDSDWSHQDFICGCSSSRGLRGISWQLKKGRGCISLGLSLEKEQGQEEVARPRS